MRLVLTGGAGFIGQNLVRYLNTAGNYSLRIIDNFSAGLSRKEVEEWLSDVFPSGLVGNDLEWDSKICLIEGDVRDSDLAMRACAGADGVVHMAANAGVMESIEDPRSDFEMNATGTLNYLEASRVAKVDRFVFCSSAAVLGEQHSPVSEESPLRPLSPYGASKLAGEAYCSAYFQSYGISAISLRFGNVYGPLSKHKTSVISKFIKGLRDGNPIRIFGDGSQTRDFVYVVDLCRAIEHALVAREAGGEVIQIASGTETTVSEVADTVASLVAAKWGRKVQIENDEARRGEIKKIYFDISHAQSRLNWEPKTSIQQGIRETLEWFDGASK